MGYVGRLSVIALSILLISFLVLSCGDGGGATGSDFDNNTADINGSVVTDGTQDGIGDVLIRLTQSGSTIDSIYTSESGGFTFDDLDEGEYLVNAILPEGFEISGPSSQSVTLTGSNANVNFSATPIREQTEVVEQGTVQTLTVSTGASITVDATNSSSDIEIGIEEVPIDQQSIDGATNGEYRVTIGSDQIQGSLPNFNEAVAPIIPIEITQKLLGGEDPSAINMKFNIGSVLEPVYSFAKGIPKEFEDENTRKKYSVISHSFDFSGEPLEFNYTLDQYSVSCSDSDRTLREYSSNFTGETPLILVHGWQKFWDDCSDFDDFNPASDYFDTLVNSLDSDSDITNEYRLYIYKYTTNTSISENGKVLRDLMESNNINDAVIIAHSMGGLVSRSMMLQGGEDRVNRLITLGTPHEGSPVADVVYNRDATEALKSRYNCIDGNLDTCVMLNIGSLFVPKTPGLYDLQEKSEFILDMIDKKGDPSKTLTIGGKLERRSELGISEDNLFTATAADILFYIYEVESDGVVPTKSATPEWSGIRELLPGIDHSEIRDGSIPEVFNEIRALLVGESIITSGDFAITNNAYPNDRYEDVSDWDQIVNDNFGSEYKVADWTDLENYHANGGNLLELFDDLGLTDYNQSVSVTRNGVKKYSSSRYYFASRHEGNKPGNYLAHDNINNYEISLGSWWGDRKILAIKR